MIHASVRLPGRCASQCRQWPSNSSFAAILLVVLALLVSACGGRTSTDALAQPAEAISLSALPDGLGRGFPTVEIDTRSTGRGALRAGAEAPNFTLRLDDGRFLNLHDLRGRPVLINFWASWCGPCRLEMPDIVAQAQADPDLVVLAINVQETMAHVQPFVEEFHMIMPVALDANAELRNLYQVRGMPSSVFIDRSGNISTIWSGILDGVLLQQLIDGIR
ncbi:MAG: TlpA family protein disulfide reductase [Caldilineaceae bacterium]|nr:TlpA family protein disulfide reductase [Caldilineaceae bacterium]